MALNIPMPEAPGTAFTGGVNTGSLLFSRLMQPIIAREQLKQKQDQFAQEYLLNKQKEARVNALQPYLMQHYMDQHKDVGMKSALQPYLIQNYQDTHSKAANELKNKLLYQGIIQDALNSGAPTTGGTSNVKGTSAASQNADSYPALNKLFSGQGMFPEGEIEHGNIDLGNRPRVPNPDGGTSTVLSMSIGTPKGEALIPRVSDDGRILSEKQAIDLFNKTGKHLGIYSSPEEATRAAEMIHQQQAQSILPNNADQASPNMSTSLGGQEQELRAGNPNLSKLDKVAGLVPGIPKPATHYSNGIIYTTYPSGRMTAQSVNLPAAKTAGEKTVSAREASKIRDKATALVNSANLVQQGYDVLDSHPNLTGPATAVANYFNLLNNEDLGKFTSITGKLQGELGKYVSSQGGIGAVKWAESVKPSTSKQPEVNYGMFNELQNNLSNDYKSLNEQYKAATGEDLPVKLPEMKSARVSKKQESPSEIKVINGKKYEKINGKWHEHP